MIRFAAIAAALMLYVGIGWGVGLTFDDARRRVCTKERLASEAILLAGFIWPAILVGTGAHAGLKWLAGTKSPDSPCRIETP